MANSAHFKLHNRQNTKTKQDQAANQTRDIEYV